LWNLGRSEESLRHTQQALKLNPNLIDARMNLAEALIAKGKYDDAIAQLENVLRLNPQHESAKNLLLSAQEKRNGNVQP
jgi:tetratricopeptide (TPR) repeat protein